MIREERSPLDSTDSTESFITPVSSAGDLMALSPKKYNSKYIHDNSMSDLLTGNDFENICDVSMQEYPTELFDLDYLVKCTDSNKTSVSNIDRERDSLMVKFDPLYSRNKQSMQIRHNKTINIPENDIGYETGSSSSTIDQSVYTPKRTTSMQFNINKEKPMQIVPPAVNHTIASVNPSQQTRPVPPLVRSVSAIMSPAPVPIDRLINITSNTPPTQKTQRNHQHERYNCDGADRLYSLRIILQTQEQEIHQLNKENRDLKYQLQDSEKRRLQHAEEMEDKIKKLTHDKELLLEEKNNFIEEINDKMRNNKQMCIVMEEFEKTMYNLIVDQQKSNLEYQEIQGKLKSERDEALKHLSSMESSFNDLLSKYEKCKAIIMETKEREQKFQEQISEYEMGMKKYESLYENLKKVTSENLEKANNNLEEIKKSHCAEITKSNATIKKQEVLILSLQESLAQKERDNEKLTSICDELITKVR